MIGIAEIRRKLEAAKAHYKGSDPAAFAKTIDDAVASLQAQYGDQFPAVAAVRFLEQLSFPAPGPGAAPADPKKTPYGVSIQWTPVGFLLRAANGSWIAGLVWPIFVAVLGAIPFVVFPDLLRSLFDAEGLWLGIAFLVACAGGALYALAIGAVANFGGIRIAKTGAEGEIFTGIGSLGRTHRVRWNDFYGAGDSVVTTPMRASGAPAISSACMGLPAASSSATI